MDPKQPWELWNLLKFRNLFWLHNQINWDLILILSICIYLGSYNICLLRRHPHEKRTYQVLSHGIQVRYIYIKGEEINQMCEIYSSTLTIVPWALMIMHMVTVLHLSFQWSLTVTVYIYDVIYLGNTCVSCKTMEQIHINNLHARGI